MANKNNDYVWKDRRRVIFGLPWSFTKYRLKQDKLLITSGVFTQQEDEIRLYRIMDITLRRKFGERLFGLGTIHCCSGDKTSPEFDIKRIKKPRYVKELLSEMVEKERMERRVGLREYMVDDEDGDGIDDNDDDDDIHG